MLKQIIKRIAKYGALIFVISNIIVNALNYIISIISSWRLIPIEYGELNSLFSLVFIFAIPTFVFYTLTSNLITEELNKDKKDLNGIFNKLFSQSVYVGLILFFTIIFFSSFLSDYLHTTFASIIIVSLQVLFSFILAVLRGYAQGIQDFLHLGFSFFLEVIMKFSFVLFVLYYLQLGVFEVLVAIFLSTFFATIYTIYSLKLNIDFKGIKNSFVNFGDYTYVFYLTVGIFGIIFLSNIDIILVRHFLPESSGEYAILSRLGQLIFMGATIFISMFTPKFVEIYNKGESTKKIFLTCYGIIIAGSVFALSIYAFIPDLLIGTLFGEKYTAIAYLLFTVGISFSLFSFGSLIVNYLLAIRRYYGILAILFPTIYYVIMVFMNRGDIENYVNILLVSNVIFFLLAHISLFILYIQERDKNNSKIIV